MSYSGDLGRIRFRSPIGINLDGGFRMSLRSPTINVESKADRDARWAGCQRQMASVQFPSNADLARAYMKRFGGTPVEADARVADLLAQKRGARRNCTAEHRSEGVLGIRLAAQGAEIDLCCELDEHQKTASAAHALMRELTGQQPAACGLPGIGPLMCRTVTRSPTDEAALRQRILASAQASRAQAAAMASSSGAAAGQAYAAYKAGQAAASAPAPALPSTRPPQTSAPASGGFPWVPVVAGVIVLGAGGAWLLLRK